jgi:hypothetical protein
VTENLGRLGGDQKNFDFFLKISHSTITNYDQIFWSL